MTQATGALLVKWPEDARACAAIAQRVVDDFRNLKVDFWTNPEVIHVCCRQDAMGVLTIQALAHNIHTALAEHGTIFGVFFDRRCPGRHVSEAGY